MVDAGGAAGGGDEATVGGGGEARDFVAVAVELFGLREEGVPGEGVFVGGVGDGVEGGGGVLGGLVIREGGVVGVDGLVGEAEDGHVGCVGEGGGRGGQGDGGQAGEEARDGLGGGEDAEELLVGARDEGGWGEGGDAVEVVAVDLRAGQFVPGVGGGPLGVQARGLVGRGGEEVGAVARPREARDGAGVARDGEALVPGVGGGVVVPAAPGAGAAEGDGGRGSGRPEAGPEAADAARGGGGALFAADLAEARHGDPDARVGVGLPDGEGVVGRRREELEAGVGRGGARPLGAVDPVFVAEEQGLEHDAVLLAGRAELVDLVAGHEGADGHVDADGAEGGQGGALVNAPDADVLVLAGRGEEEVAAGRVGLFADEVEGPHPVLVAGEGGLEGELEYGAVVWCGSGCEDLDSAGGSGNGHDDGLCVMVERAQGDGEGQVPLGGLDGLEERRLAAGLKGPHFDGSVCGARSKDASLVVAGLGGSEGGYAVDRGRVSLEGLDTGDRARLRVGSPYPQSEVIAAGDEEADLIAGELGQKLDSPDMGGMAADDVGDSTGVLGRGW